jgi:transcriptional regulator with XRE-family HTH domain
MSTNDLAPAGSTPGRRLKAARKFHHLTQQQAADQCSVDISTWNKWEKDKNPIDPILIRPFVLTHSVTLDWLFYGRNVRIGSEALRALESQISN